MLMSGSCNLAEECPQFPYQAQILCLPGGTVIQIDMSHTQTQHLPVGAMTLAQLACTYSGSQGCQQVWQLY